MTEHCFLFPLDAVEKALAKDSVSTSESAEWLDEYLYFAIALALVILATRRYGTTVVEKLKDASIRRKK